MNVLGQKGRNYFAFKCLKSSFLDKYAKFKEFPKGHEYFFDKVFHLNQSDMERCLLSDSTNW